MTDYRAHRHVVSELDKYSGQIKRGETSSFILCPFHSERTGSFRIFHSPSSRSPGFGKCYGCGKTAKWDELAPVIGLKPIKWSKPEEQFAHRVSRQEQQKEERERKMLLSDLPADKYWRSISTNLLIAIGARKGRFYYPDADVFGKSWVYLPVLVNSELKGYTRAALKKLKDKPSYINSSGGWTKDYGLFPYDYVAALRPRYVILVEGQRDTLRLLQAKMPALAIMGTQSWSERKSRLIEMLGVELAILMTDGDDAGLAAIDLIKPQLSKLVNTKIFNLAGKDSPYWRFRKEDSPSKAAKAAGVELWDPQNMPDHKLAELKSKIREWL
jgi:DNA primase